MLFWFEEQKDGIQPLNQNAKSKYYSLFPPTTNSVPEPIKLSREQIQPKVAPIGTGRPSRSNATYPTNRSLDAHRTYTDSYQKASVGNQVTYPNSTVNAPRSGFAPTIPIYQPRPPPFPPTTGQLPGMPPFRNLPMTFPYPPPYAPAPVAWAVCRVCGHSCPHNIIRNAWYVPRLQRSTTNNVQSHLKPIMKESTNDVDTTKQPSYPLKNRHGQYFDRHQRYLQRKYKNYRRLSNKARANGGINARQRDSNNRNDPEEIAPVDSPNRGYKYESKKGNSKREQPRVFHNRKYKKPFEKKEVDSGQKKEENIG